MNKISSFTYHMTGEGPRLSCAYANIDEEKGYIISDNNRESFVILEGIGDNDKILECIQIISNYLSAKINEQ